MLCSLAYFDLMLQSYFSLVPNNSVIGKFHILIIIKMCDRCVCFERINFHPQEKMKGRRENAPLDRHNNEQIVELEVVVSTTL